MIILSVLKRPPRKRLTTLKGSNYSLDYTGLYSAAFAAPFFPVLFIPGFWHQFYFILNFLCLLSAAYGITLLNISVPRFKQKGVFFLIFSTGIMFSLTTGYKMQPIPFYSGIPISHVTGFSGVLSQDSINLKGGRILYSLSTRKVFRLNDTEADASGLITIISDDSICLSSGAAVTVNAVLIEGDDGLIAFPGKGEMLHTGWNTSVSKWRNYLRGEIITAINGLGDPAASLFETLFLGIKDDPATDVYLYFKKAGSIHILALSGLHLGILSAFAALIFVPIIGKKRAFLLSLILVVFYIFITGPKPSLLRAGVMFFLFGTAFCLNRKRDPLQI